MQIESFASRHIGPNTVEKEQMLEAIGASSMAQLVHETIPDNIRLDKDLELAAAMTEAEYLNHIQNLGEKNQLFHSYIGLGYHNTFTPSPIKRNILENPGWYTAYTPYQAEIAQGRLEALLNYQTMICDLTGMELANASLLDEATAASEAMTMLFGLRSRVQKKAGVNKFFVDQQCLPQTIAVLEAKAAPLDIEMVVGDMNSFEAQSNYFGLLLQYPGKYGEVRDIRPLVKKAQEAEIKTAVAADILSLVLLEAPGAFGVDVVVGTSQRFGIPLGYGGPHAAFFATKETYKRSIPGRIIGVTKDTNGNRALRMALQTREQHIKRDKATSNICTAQVLLAVMAGMYAVYHGPDGLRHIASQVHQNAQRLEAGLRALGFAQHNTHYFDTLVVEAPADEVKSQALKNGINFLYIDADRVGISINETTNDAQLQGILDVFAAVKNTVAVPIVEQKTTVGKIPSNLARSSEILTDEVFGKYHSETELMRYIKKLERKDLSLNHSMISLGSCTMKLNAASEMLPLSDAHWGGLHPFVPVNQVKGYQTVLKTLEDQLSEITGFAATSLQPNSGAQGEYSGLMVIRAYHENRNEGYRNICLIPASAHGTNPASAVLAGMKVVVTKTAENGNIDVEDLRQKAELHKDNLAALMVTYPSTHGVFESTICEINDIVHQYGGQVYMDGANMNAQVGLTNPAKIGADVCHLNLHKTFAIPHGGGGPGVGPICVAQHLAPFLPSNPIVPTGGENPLSAISAAPWGSALVCLISYGYIKMLGAEGLKNATEFAILNANYMQKRLEVGGFEILYKGESGRAAHEMIVDCRPFKANGIEVVDIAKRLMDYGYHAPTVSFPVAGTLMIEPTESENKAEIDRFCDALIAIKSEIEKCEAADAVNPLRNAPHTLEMLTADEWQLPYSRTTAAYPLEYVRDSKFWPSVRRVDEAYGDRNLICTCTPIEAYQE
ncbi:MAG: aminomethyl-transferring glycine dehydrogenase [Flavobacteriaceae bacterium]|nr:aminomethyl-transferring glycine dehydrogenase [Flavobacteriaceae bacterium]